MPGLPLDDPLLAAVKPQTPEPSTPSVVLQTYLHDQTHLRSYNRGACEWTFLPETWIEDLPPNHPNWFYKCRHGGNLLSLQRRCIPLRPDIVFKPEALQSPSLCQRAQGLIVLWRASDMYSVKETVAATPQPDSRSRSYATLVLALSQWVLFFVLVLPFVLRVCNEVNDGECSD